MYADRDKGMTAPIRNKSTYRAQAAFDSQLFDRIPILVNLFLIPIRHRFRRVRRKRKGKRAALCRSLRHVFRKGPVGIELIVSLESTASASRQIEGINDLSPILVAPDLLERLAGPFPRARSLPGPFRVVSTPFALQRPSPISIQATRRLE